MHISKSISKDQRSITFLYETLNNRLMGKNLTIMNVFDLVTEFRLMFETNATNESICIKTFNRLLLQIYWEKLQIIRLGLFVVQRCKKCQREVIICFYYTFSLSLIASSSHKQGRVWQK